MAKFGKIFGHTAQVRCDHIWQNFATFAKIIKSCAKFGPFGIREKFKPALANFILLGTF